MKTVLWGIVCDGEPLMDFYLSQNKKWVVDSLELVNKDCGEMIYRLAKFEITEVKDEQES